MRVLVTGSQGALGQDVSRVFAANGHEIFNFSKDTLDITDLAQVSSVLQKVQPQVVINCAAYNLVDNVESEDIYPLAYAVNAQGPANLAQVAKELQATLVHISTDYVFAGDSPTGYREVDQKNPISKYGSTKAAGEDLVAEVGGKYFIVRTSKLFGKPSSSAGAKESFVHLMLRLAASLPELRIVNEEVGCPTYTLDLAEGLLHLVTLNPEKGVYHLVNSGAGVTWYEFAEEIFALKNVTTPRQPVASKDFPKPAARPKQAALLNTKLPALRSRQAALRAFLEL